MIIVPQSTLSSPTYSAGSGAAYGDGRKLQQQRASHSTSSLARSRIRAAMIWRPFVRCKNPRCVIPGQQILLPYSSPAGKDASPPASPTGMFPARVVCHGCAHWYVYSELEHDWSQLSEPPRLIGAVAPRTWTVTMKCGQPNCSSLIRWHIQDDLGVQADEITRKIYASKPEIVCEQGHPLWTPQSVVVAATYFRPM